MYVNSEYQTDGTEHWNTRCANSDLVNVACIVALCNTGLCLVTKHCSAANCTYHV